MATMPRTPPRFVPTLTERIHSENEPHSRNQRPDISLPLTSEPQEEHSATIPSASQARAVEAHPAARVQAPSSSFLSRNAAPATVQEVQKPVAQMSGKFEPPLGVPSTFGDRPVDASAATVAGQVAFREESALRSAPSQQTVTAPAGIAVLSGSDHGSLRTAAQAPVVAPVASDDSTHVPSGFSKPIIAADFEEMLVHRVLQRVDVALASSLRRAISSLVHEQTLSMLPRLREEVEIEVLRAVNQAVGDELAAQSKN